MSDDVLKHILHEHRHLVRLFDDAYESFSKISRSELDDSELNEALQTAADDLEVALEDMITHFNQEEEVLFVEIENRFPSMAEAIESLVQNHEAIAADTRWLLAFSGRRNHKSAEFEEALSVVSRVRDAISAHTRDEARIYGEALSLMDEASRAKMLDEMKEL